MIIRDPKTKNPPCGGPLTDEPTSLSNGLLGDGWPFGFCGTKRRDGFSLRECGDAILFQIEYEQLDNKEVKECLGKLENHQELVYIT